MSAYNFPVQNGNRIVTLKFAEIYPWCQYIGCRIFNVKLEGATVLTNFDIYREANGSYRALDKTFTVIVSDGILNIDFQTVKNSGKISAIEVR